MSESSAKFIPPSNTPSRWGLAVLRWVGFTLTGLILAWSGLMMFELAYGMYGEDRGYLFGLLRAAGMWLIGVSFVCAYRSTGHRLVRLAR
jgi:hypothetical protein